MGFKTTNYEVKDLGDVLPQAYARIVKLTVEDDRATAKFVIQKNREFTQHKKPYEVVVVENIPITNKKENPFTTAYNYAKGQHNEYPLNEKTNQVEKVLVNNSIFYGWQDDYV